MDIHDEPPMLPGFDPEATRTGDSGLRDAAISTLGALKDAGLLTEKHALTAQLLIATATRAGIGLQAGRTTIATTNLIRLVTDLLDKLPMEHAGVADEATRFLEALHAAENGARQP